MRTLIYVLISRDDGLQSTEHFSALYRSAPTQGVKITAGPIDFRGRNPKRSTGGPAKNGDSARSCGGSSKPGQVMEGDCPCMWSGRVHSAETL